jgi:CRP-like cAMP-binding protein
VNQQLRNSSLLIRTTLANVRLFALWPTAVLDSLSAGSSYRRYGAGEVILRMGVPTNHMVVIANGTACSQRTLKNGKTVVFDFLFPGQSTGHLALFDNEAPAFDIMAKSDVEVVLVPREVLLAAVSQDTGRLMDIIQFLCRRTRFDYEATHMRIANTLRCQIAKLLLYWGRGPQQHGDAGFKVPVALSQDDLAAVLGVSRQTVNREINTLTKEGLLSRRYRQIFVVDAPGLLAILEAEDVDAPGMKAALFARPKSVFNATD